MYFMVYDGTADGHKFNQDQDGYYPGKRLPVGAESPEDADLQVLSNVDVYVVSRSFSDTLLVWQRTNRMDPLAQDNDSVMMSQFYDFYNEYGYKLTRLADGSYDLMQAYAKARQIYMKFHDIWDYWGDGPGDFELIIHHHGEPPVGSSVQNGAERHRIRDIVRYYSDGMDVMHMCPLFYDGKVTGVETQYEVAAKPKYVKRVVSLGHTLEFEEDVAVAGRSDERITVERYIETCAFDEDYDALMKRKAKMLEEEALHNYDMRLRRVMKSVLAKFYQREEWPGFVVPGKDFELGMRRRTAFDLEHDTLNQYRMQTERFFGYNNDTVPERLYLQADTLKVHQKISYEMPDPNRYYHMKHTVFIQDFAHVEGIDREECPCYRTNDLHFLSLAAQYANIDCAPYLPGNIERETYQPVSTTKEFRAVQQEARLMFDRGRSDVNAKLGNNQMELDSLRSIAARILADTATKNRIDTILVVAISSPEGSSHNFNLQLSGRRAKSVADWVLKNCEGTKRARSVVVDSVASWLDVADIVESFGELNKPLADSIRAAVGDDDLHNTFEQQRRIGYQLGKNLIIDRALQQLRKVQIGFMYKAQHDPSKESVYVTYRHGANREKFSAYHYYSLLKNDSVSYEDKLQLAREVVNRPMLPGDSYLRTRYPEGEMVLPEQWFDLIRPVAANMLAIESIRKREYDLEILAPYLTPDARINTTVYDIEENRPYKYINADFAVYNQLAMLLGKGDEESLNQADLYLQMFQNARVSEEFREKYRPNDLIDLVMCYTSPSLLQDTELAERIKRTGIVNYFVIEMSQIHESYLYELGQIYSAALKEEIRGCYERLPELLAADGFDREKAYFEAVTEGRYADFVGADEERAGASMEEAQQIKDAHIDAAVDALVRLFEEEEDMISFCQGDRYVRGVYRNPLYKSQGIDYYLEAVDEYVKRMEMRGE